MAGNGRGYPLKSLTTLRIDPRTEGININLAALVLLALVAGVYIVLGQFFGIKFDPREPQVVAAKIPYIGHILGFVRHGQSYLEKISKKNKLPIYTIQILNKKVYVVNSPELIQAVDRASKTVSLYPFIALIGPRLMDADKEDMTIINRNLNLEEGPWGLCYEISQGMHATMAPGPNLDRMNEAMLSRFLPQLNGLDQGLPKGVEIELFRWGSRAFAVAGCDAIYGPGNPFAKDLGLIDDFWAFDEGLGALIMGLPTPAARRAHRRRARIFKAMQEYFDNGDHERGLDTIKMRYRVGTAHGSSHKSLSHFEIGDLIGILVNATPTFFWVVLHVYSDKELLQAIRKELEAFVVVSKGVDGCQTKHSIDITTLQDACPLLVSTFREVLRWRTQFSTTRWVTQDTLLADRYLLTKDSVVQMPSGVVHTDATAWGPDVGLFNPRRFMKEDAVPGLATSNGNVTKKAERVHPGAYRAWGGGQTLCPGRFFATAEITSTLAMWVARFDVEPKSGKWAMPPEDGSRLASSVHPPSQDVKVVVRTRSGLEGHQWEYVFGDKGHTG